MFSKAIVLSILCCRIAVMSEVLPAKTGTPLMENFDFEKYSENRWWVTYRNNVLHGIDRCIVLSFGRFFDDEKIYKRTDYENSGSVDTSYQPVIPGDNGYSFLFEEGLRARVDVVDTDYSTYSIVEVFLRNSTHAAEDHLAILTSQPTPSDEDTKVIAERLGRVFSASVQISDLEKVNNVDCPVDQKTQQVL